MLKSKLCNLPWDFLKNILKQKGLQLSNFPDHRCQPVTHPTFAPMSDLRVVPTKPYWPQVIFYSKENLDCFQALGGVCGYFSAGFAGPRKVREAFILWRLPPEACALRYQSLRLAIWIVWSVSVHLPGCLEVLRSSCCLGQTELLWKCSASGLPPVYVPSWTIRRSSAGEIMPKGN